MLQSNTQTSLFIGGMPATRPVTNSRHQTDMKKSSKPTTVMSATPVNNLKISEPKLPNMGFKNQSVLQD